MAPLTNLQKARMKRRPTLTSMQQALWLELDEIHARLCNRLKRVTGPKDLSFVLRDELSHAANAGGHFGAFLGVHAQEQKAEKARKRRLGRELGRAGVILFALVLSAAGVSCGGLSYDADAGDAHQVDQADQVDAHQVDRADQVDQADQVDAGDTRPALQLCFATPPAAPARFEYSACSDVRCAACRYYDGSTWNVPVVVSGCATPAGQWCVTTDYMGNPDCSSCGGAP